MKEKLFQEYGITETSTDNDIERVSEIIAMDSDIIFEYRDHHREIYINHIQYVVTDTTCADTQEYFDCLEKALDRAMELAIDQANTADEINDLDQWGDSMETGWGVCPENESGVYWPQVHAEYDGKRIDKLPWE